MKVTPGEQSAQCSSELSITYNDSCTFLIALIEALLKSYCFASIYPISITLFDSSLHVAPPFPLHQERLVRFLVKHVPLPHSTSGEASWGLGQRTFPSGLWRGWGQGWGRAVLEGEENAAPAHPAWPPWGAGRCGYRGLYCGVEGLQPASSEQGWPEAEACCPSGTVCPQD